MSTFINKIPNKTVTSTKEMIIPRLNPPLSWHFLSHTWGKNQVKVVRALGDGRGPQVYNLL